MEQWVRRALGVLQVGGGLTGVYLILSKLSMNSTFMLPIAVVFAALFAFGVVAGVALIERGRWGRRLSIVHWWLQVPVFVSPLIAYSFWSGAVLTFSVRLDVLRLGFNFYWGAAFEFSLLRATQYSIGVNLFAVLALWLLHEFVSESTHEPRTPPVLEPRPSLAERVSAERESASENP